MARRERVWVRVRTLTQAEKADIAAACNRLIAEVLKPRHLPEIQPTPFNYPVDLHGKWRGSKFSFLTRYRSGFPHNAGEEFDATFARLDHVEQCFDDIRFDVMWRRHTGQYWPLHREVPLAEALRLVETELASKTMLMSEPNLRFDAQRLCGPNSMVRRPTGSISRAAAPTSAESAPVRRSRTGFLRAHGRNRARRERGPNRGA